MKKEEDARQERLEQQKIALAEQALADERHTPEPAQRTVERPERSRVPHPSASCSVAEALTRTDRRSAVTTAARPRSRGNPSKRLAGASASTAQSAFQV
jgi:hypothetical protein